MTHRPFDKLRNGALGTVSLRTGRGPLTRKQTYPGKSAHVPASMAVAVMVAACGAFPAGAAEFRSVAESAAVLYDAPSAKAKKLYVVGHGYPVEVVVVVEGWSKVRDASGELTWIESKQLSEKRTVVVRMPVAQVREAADDSAPVAFQAQQHVLLELLEVAGSGWLRVRHRDGPSGYIRVAQVWGV